MNNALIAIGVFRPEIEKITIDSAERIGKVVVDHGETNCITPNAIDYIVKANKRRKNNK